MSPRVFSYARYSSAGQADGDSLHRQSEAARRFSESVGMPMDQELRLVDAGVSAWKGDNWDGAFGQFLDAVKAGSIPRGSILYVESLDRVSRQAPKKVLPLFLSILAAGVSIHADGRLFRHDNDQDFTIDVLSAIISMQRAWEESQRKSERVGAAKAQQRKATIAEGKPFSKKCPAWIKPVLDPAGKVLKWEVVDGVAATVRRIFDDYADRGKGAELIAKALNAEGVPGMALGKRKGKYWSAASVTQLLKQKTVLGIYTPGHGNKKTYQKGDVEVPGYYPAVVTQEIWDRSQAVRGLRRSKFNRGAGRKGDMVGNLFSGRLLHCGACGNLIRYHNKGQRKKTRKDGSTWVQQSPSVILRCDASTMNVERCKMISWNYKDFETSFLSFVREMQGAVRDGGREEQLTLQVRAEEGRLQDAERRRDNLLDLLTDIPSKALKERYGAAEKAVTLAEATLQAARQELAECQAAEMSREAATVLAMATTPDDRLALQHHIRQSVERIEMYPRKFLVLLRDGSIRHVNPRWRHSIGSADIASKEQEPWED